MRVTGAFTVESGNLTIDLDDGRVISVDGNGEIQVWANRDRFGGMADNRYRLTLPTFFEVAAGCDSDGDGTFTVEGHHAH